MKSIFWLLAIVAFAYAEQEGVVRRTKATCNLPEDVINDIASYKDDVKRIMDYFQGEYKGQTYKRISDFVDKFGTRLTGSVSLESAIDEILKVSVDEDLVNVHGEDMEVDHWMRGVEYANLIEPRPKKLPMLGLGNSIPTPEGGIQAEAIVVRDFDELKGLSDDAVRGKIVIYDQVWKEYGPTVVYRNRGATEASKKGAVAALVKSIAPFSIATPHTGVQDYDEDVIKIPVAAITHEDADFLRREQERGHKIIIKLVMSATVEKKQARNAVADLEGSELKEKVVIISGHIDSWDVGDGSMDDAGGFFISWVAPVVLKKMDLIPRRTLRTVMFTAEEQGLYGAIEYEEKHRQKSDDLVFLMESDSGTFAARGLNYQGSDEGECMMVEILKHFAEYNAAELVLLTPAAPDISIWTNKGFPGVGFHNDNKKYFWFHHTEGDMLNVLDSDVMDINAGFWTSVAYIVADMKYEVPKNGSAKINAFIFATLLPFILSRIVLSLFK